MMQAGRELDALIAKVFFDWQDVQKDATGWWCGHPPSWPHPRVIFTAPPEYSTSIAAAWTVVEHLRGRVVIDHWSGNEYKVMIYIPSSGRPSVEASADTAPLAICLAALAAVGADLS